MHNTTTIFRQSIESEKQKAKPEDMEDQLIETIDEDGNVVKFELIDIVELEGKEYGLLLPHEEKQDEV